MVEMFVGNLNEPLSKGVQDLVRDATTFRAASFLHSIYAYS